MKYSDLTWENDLNDMSPTNTLVSSHFRGIDELMYSYYTENQAVIDTLHYNYNPFNIEMDIVREFNEKDKLDDLVAIVQLSPDRKIRQVIANGSELEHWVVGFGGYSKATISHKKILNKLHSTYKNICTEIENNFNKACKRKIKFSADGKNEEQNIDTLYNNLNKLLCGEITEHAETLGIFYVGDIKIGIKSSIEAGEKPDIYFDFEALRLDNMSIDYGEIVPNFGCSVEDLYKSYSPANKKNFVKNIQNNLGTILEDFSNMRSYDEICSLALSDKALWCKKKEQDFNEADKILLEADLVSKLSESMHISLDKTMDHLKIPNEQREQVKNAVFFHAMKNNVKQL